jgi:hypothetical protein
MSDYITLGISAGFPVRKIDETCDYTTFGFQTHAVAFYVSVFFTFERKSWNVERKQLTAQIYYGLGSNSGPKSATKRHYCWKIWKEQI